MEFTINIAAARHNRGWTLEEACKHIITEKGTPIGIATLTRYENGHEVPLKNRKRIAKAYGVPLELMRWKN